MRGLGISLLVLLLAGGLFAGLWLARDHSPPPLQPAAATPAAHIQPLLQQCATCHNTPPPDILPKDAWHRVIRSMNERVSFYKLGIPLTEEQITQVSDHFAALAPESLPTLDQNYPPSPLAFQPAIFGTPPDSAEDARPPIITHLLATDINGDRKPDIIVCDATADAVTLITPTAQGWAELLLAKAPAPAHAEIADLDANGSADIIVACLGTMQPTEDPAGKILRIEQHGREIRTTEIAAGLPRAADVRAADIDGDGDLDLIVALFGMYRTGGVMLFEHASPGKFNLRYLLHNNGVSHIGIADLNADGRPDIVALISQQHERVAALINKGGGAFDELTLFQAPHPIFGCSSLEIADLDRDNDPDILFTNGDLLDFDTGRKPYHGVQWLENRGGLSFEYRDIARFYGAYSVKPADLDGDNDTDLVITSMGNDWSDPLARSIVWMENDGNQRFTIRPISASPTYLVTSAIADLDGDSRPDILAGGMYVMPPFHRVGRITLFQNRGPITAAAPPANPVPGPR